MKNSKLDYSAPETEVVVVRIERTILSGKLNGQAQNRFNEQADIVDGDSEMFW